MNDMDEYTLAAFMSGQLSNAERDQVMAQLAQDDDLREVMQMAMEAMNTPPRPPQVKARAPHRSRWAA